MSKNKLFKRTRREFFLKFFNQEFDHNETIELNGCILFKHWDGNMKEWRVDLFTPESYKAMKERIPKTQDTSLF